MKTLAYSPHITELIDVVKDPSPYVSGQAKNTSLVMTHVKATDFEELMPNMTDLDVRYYTY